MQQDKQSFCTILRHRNNNNNNNNSDSKPRGEKMPCIFLAHSKYMLIIQVGQYALDPA